MQIYWLIINIYKPWRNNTSFSFLVLSELCINLPTQVSICWSLLFKRKKNLLHLSNWNFEISVRLSRMKSLSVLFTTHPTKKCFSSSSARGQNKQHRSLSLVFGWVYLPCSIARVCEVGLNWALAVLYLWFLINPKYELLPIVQG